MPLVIRNVDLGIVEFCEQQRGVKQIHLFIGAIERLHQLLFDLPLVLGNSFAPQTGGFAFEFVSLLDQRFGFVRRPRFDHSADFKILKRRPRVAELRQANFAVRDFDLVEID